MRPEVKAAHQRYWSAIRSEMTALGIASPMRLSDTDDLMSMWLSPELVLSQTCGMPYRLHLHEKVTLIGTPDFGVRGCEPGYYRSVFIVRRNDSRSQVDEYANDVFAFNTVDSQSGYAAPYVHCKSVGFWFQKTLETGAHSASVRAVLEGRASLAAIDAVTWQLLSVYEPAVTALRVLESTAPTPGLPYISAITADENKTFAAVSAAIDKLRNNEKALLQLKGLVSIDKADYLAVANPDVRPE